MSIRNLRSATPDDYEAYARLFPEMDLSDPVPGPDHYEANVMPEAAVWEEDGRVVGFLLTQILANAGYVRHVIVDPEARGRGIGRALMHAAAERLRRAGLTRWALNVKPDNPPAVELYRSLGMTRVHSSASYRMEWSVTERLPASPADVDVTAAAPGTYAPIESQLGLSAGLLKLHNPDCRILVAHRDDTPIGVASFNPRHPGAYPFRAPDVPVAAALLRACRPFADAQAPYVQLVFEDQAYLEPGFEAAGATLHLRFDHYAGPLPPPGSGGPPV